MSDTRVLFTGVFGPYGIRNRYAEAQGMQMELLNNQITREQGVHSPRQSYWTFPLYLLAENISAPSVVLDFPRWRHFKRELKKGYTHVAINFILPNALKAKRMVEYIRKNYPRIKIILGGYGASIPRLSRYMSFDALCRGEGVSWLRKYFGDRPDAPVTHPAIHGPAFEAIYGYRGKPKGSVLLPGVGCENGCRFCATSHQFEKKYLMLLKSGREMFDACRKSEDALKATGFSIMDENFLKNPQRAMELLQVMTAEQKPYVFDIFSSAEVIRAMGVDFLVRLGIRMIWIGVESKHNTHAKTRGIDLHALIEELQSKGIIVNASAILFQDHHTDETIREEIDWVISLNSNLVQFMNYTPLPATSLHDEMRSEKRLKKMECRHITGAGELAFTHPHINDREKHAGYLRGAFRKKYLAHGPGVVAMAETAIRGYARARADHHERRARGLSWNPETLRYEKTAAPADDAFMELRIRKMQKMAMNIRPVLLAAYLFAPNGQSRRRTAAVMKQYRRHLGRCSLSLALQSCALVFTAAREQVKIWANRLRGRECVIYQPPVRRACYPGDPSLKNA